MRKLFVNARNLLVITPLRGNPFPDCPYFPSGKSAESLPTASSKSARSFGISPSTTCSSRRRRISPTSLPEKPSAVTSFPFTAKSLREKQASEETISSRIASNLSISPWVPWNCGAWARLSARLMAIKRRRSSSPKFINARRTLFSVRGNTLSCHSTRRTMVKRRSLGHFNRRSISSAIWALTFGCP